MAKWIITWNAGRGERANIIRAPDKDGAIACAYLSWEAEARYNGSYSAERYLKSRVAELGLEDDEEE